MDEDAGLGMYEILEAVSEGVYATDSTRKIVYWGRGAEQITGWPAGEIVGKRCYDNILCHIDKDGHRLCGEEHCPLHRCIVTGRGSTVPIIMFARTRAGGRVPLNVSVAPVRDAGGRVIGGVETFRDLSPEFDDIQRVRSIQLLSLRKTVPDDERIRFATRYVPRDIIGGDYHAITQLDADRYGFLLADVTGHGVPAALYTMCLSSLWDANCHLMASPRLFAAAVNKDLHRLIREDEPFAAAICGLFDLAHRELRFVGAGNPTPLVMHPDGRWEHPEGYGLPLGLMEGTAYQEHVVRIGPGDCVLFFTDGAVDITDLDGGYLDAEGLARILRELGYPEANVSFPAIEERLLRYSDRIRFDDDVTFIEARIGQLT